MWDNAPVTILCPIYVGLIGNSVSHTFRCDTIKIYPMSDAGTLQLKFQNQRLNTIDFMAFAVNKY